MLQSDRQKGEEEANLVDSDDQLELRTFGFLSEDAVSIRDLDLREVDQGEVYSSKQVGQSHSLYVLCSCSETSYANVVAHMSF